MSYPIPGPEELKRLAGKADGSSRKWIAGFNKKQANKLDDAAQLLHDKIFAETDCLTCANCCKSISPTLYDKDIERLAKATRTKPSEFISKYLQIDEDKDYVFRETPCPFLDNENYCMVYVDRPKACREYPHTDRPRFYQILKLTLANTYVCAPAYHIMEELKKTF